MSEFEFLGKKDQEVTTISQSQYLINKMYLKHEYASKVYVAYKDTWIEESYTLKDNPNDERGCWKIHAFTKEDLCSIIPDKFGDGYSANIHQTLDGRYVVDIENTDEVRYETNIRDSIFDAILEIVIYLIHNNEDFKYIDERYIDSEKKKKDSEKKFESFMIPNKKKETVNEKIRNKLTPVKTIISLIEEYEKSCDPDKRKKAVNTIMSMKDDLQLSLDELVKITK